jgi:Protein of unknown function (DUF2752)
MIAGLGRRLGVAATALTSIAALLLRFPPDRYNFYPRCPIYLYFHLQCPGCGATRAFAALLRGRIAEALHLNPLTTLLLPLALLYSTHHLWKQRHSIQALTWPNPHRYAVYALLVVAAVFTIARNFPS